MGLYSEIIQATANYLNRDNSPVNSLPIKDTQKHSFQSDDPPGVWKPLLGFDMSDSISSIEAYRSLVYACSNKKAYNLAKANIKIYRQFKSKKTNIDNHPFINLINSQNSFGQTFPIMLVLASLNCDAKGIAYIYVRTQDILGRKIPVELIPVPARAVLPVYDISKTTIISYSITGAAFEGMPSQMNISPNEMIVFQLPNPDSNLIPVAPYSRFNFTTQTDYMMSRAQYSQFVNDGTPPFAISYKGEMKDETFARLKCEFRAKHQGAGNNREPLFLDQEASIQTVANSPKEMDYVNSRRQIFDEIMIILDVSRQVMNDFSESNFSNSKNALMAWIRNTIEPYADIIFCQQLTAFVKRFYDTKLIVSMEYEMSDDEMELKELDLMAKHGTITKNEFREAREFEASTLEGADDWITDKSETVRDTLTNADGTVITKTADQTI